ncbi:UNVERIFIED_CONTAM: Retrovirus-related Pol polyprotein from transposon RE1 [Sesamum latifolium]|uniref:Retrovirus-related Pol polyprotein from transposon RE1 n=1 Tax=Sesamum latifolium TaxID=2727402 RepID=A0AAW2YA25_9LAMI
MGILQSVYLVDSITSTSIPDYVEKMTNVELNPSRSSPTDEESNRPRWSKRAKVVKNFGSDFVTYNIEDDPVTFKDTMVFSKVKQWKEAIKSNMDSIVSNRICILVDLPPKCTTIGCKLVLKKKLKSDGTKDKFKNRLVAKGFKQNEGIDYFSTHSKVARLNTIWVLIALGSLEGFVAHGNKHMVYKLVKSLYGLKQAPKK